MHVVAPVTQERSLAADTRQPADELGDLSAPSGRGATRRSHHGLRRRQVR